MNTTTTKKSILTHNGNFHSDELIAIALLSFISSSPLSITRSRDEKSENFDYIFDVNGEYDEEKNKFDHHQFNQENKEWGKSSAGLFFNSLDNDEIVKNKEIINLVKEADSRDTRVDYNPKEMKWDNFFNEINKCNPLDIHSKEQDERFKLMIKHLETMLEDIIINGKKREDSSGYISILEIARVTEKEKEETFIKRTKELKEIEEGVYFGEYIPLPFKRVENCNIFISYDSQQNHYTVMVDTSKGLKLENVKNQTFTHSNGFIGGYKMVDEHISICLNGKKTKFNLINL